VQWNHPEGGDDVEGIGNDWSWARDADAVERSRNDGWVDQSQTNVLQTPMPRWITKVVQLVVVEGKGRCCRHVIV